MRRDTGGIRTGRTHRRSQCALDRNGRCRALSGWWHWKELRGRRRIAERWTNRHRLVRHLVERPPPGAATLGPTGDPPALRHLYAGGCIGCWPGILSPGDDHMRRQEYLHWARVGSGDRDDEQWYDHEGSRQQSPQAGCGGRGSRKHRHDQSIPSDAIPHPIEDPPEAPTDHGPAARAARRARVWNTKATTSGGPASGRSGSVRR